MTTGKIIPGERQRRYFNNLWCHTLPKEEKREMRNFSRPECCEEFVAITFSSRQAKQLFLME